MNTHIHIIYNENIVAIDILSAIYYYRKHSLPVGLSLKELEDSKYGYKSHDRCHVIGNHVPDKGNITNWDLSVSMTFH